MKTCLKCKKPIKPEAVAFIKKIFKRPAATQASLCSDCSRPKKNDAADYKCQICDRTVDESNALTHIKAEEYLLNLIKKDHPEWKETHGACPECINYYRELIKKAKI